MLPCSAEKILATLPAEACRLLLFGEAGIGKSTLARALAKSLALRNHSCLCICADPGSPAFGMPGAVCLGEWQNGNWKTKDCESLCTLDAGRFRLPLVAAVRRLAAGLPKKATVLIDAPGVVRGVAGAEILTGLIEASAIDSVLVLARQEEKIPLVNELRTSGCEILLIRASAEARRPGKRQRDKTRTRQWDDYLRGASEKTITIEPFQLTGTPPPLPVAGYWHGRQISLLANGRTLAMGEVVDGSGQTLRIRMGTTDRSPDQFLLRDARRDRHGLLVTAPPHEKVRKRTSLPPDVVPFAGPAESPPEHSAVAKLGDATVILPSGVFNDPLLHIRLHNRKRSLLFDLGEGARLSARLAHQVSDVFISHAHFDHISGFLWLLRSRIGDLSTCRLYGPPGLARHIFALIHGILWDRIGGKGPRFEVSEWDGDRIITYGLRAGGPEKKKIGERPTFQGLLVEESDFKVRAALLDHGSIPVLAFAFEQAPKLNANKDRLAEGYISPGPWLGELKENIAAGRRQTSIKLPDGRSAMAGELADFYLDITQTRKVAYATDCADTPPNRRELIRLAAGAQTFFCEAAFVEADRFHAKESGHLTARACGEIAEAAAVERLVPFHFSRRYERNPQRIYEEVWSVCRRMVPPVTELEARKEGDAS